MIFKKFCYRIYQVVLLNFMHIIKYNNKAVSKEGAVYYIPEILKKQGVTGKVLVITGPHIAKTDIFRKIIKVFKEKGTDCVIFSGTSQETGIDSIESARWLYLYKNCKAIIAIGGGSVMDCAKAAAAGITNPGKRINRFAGYQKVRKKIPVIVAGGIFNHDDICHAISLGASGVQIASRFVATDECDADEKYKQAYVNAGEKDLAIIDSPVGMPGRAVRNKFVQYIENNKIPVKKCFNCLEKCNPAEVPYCITKALIDAVRGDTENGLVFAGANTGRIDKIVPVHDLIEELAGHTK